MTATKTVSAMAFNLAPVWRESPTPTTDDIDPSCTPYTLPSLGLLNLSTSTITLQADATFTPLCNVNGKNQYVDLDAASGPVHLRDPFYASTIPMTYSVSATSVVAYILLLLLLVSPPGSRPWLQKVATLTVVISLTIAWTEMNDVIEYQYTHGYLSAEKLRSQVVGGLVIRISRVVSDTFLWLAQVQTLIRLFPRHREKIIIKWAGFVLIILDTVFSVVNNFLSPYADDKSFLDAVPALSYLFQLALSFLYATCVLYYAFKHRYFSFVPPLSIGNQRRHASSSSNVAMPVVALVSMAAILLPIVFFILDISNKDVAGWGDFVRWVGAAAASVVVWEWVDRIERLEDLGRKRGILGREIFDGDEMLEGVGGTIVEWGDGRPGSSDHDGSVFSRGFALGPMIRPQASRNLGPSEKQQYFASHGVTNPVMPPLSRATTGSTTYAVRIHPSSVTPPVHTVAGRLSRGSSHLHETTISDLAISPAWTPSIDGHQLDVLNRSPEPEDRGAGNIAEFGSDSHQQDHEEIVDLPYVHRVGQTPFSPEQFSQQPSDGREGRFVIGKLRGIGSFFKRKKPDEGSSSNLHIPIIGGSSREDVNQRVTSPVTIPITPNSGISETSPDIHQVTSNQSLSPLNVRSDAGSRTTTRSAVSNVSSIFRRSSSRNNKGTVLPVTVIPALRKGEVVSLENLERARQRERQRQLAGDAAGLDATNESTENLGYVTRFEGVPFQISVLQPAWRNGSASPLDNGGINTRQGLQSTSSPARSGSQPSTASRRTPISPGFGDGVAEGELGRAASPQSVLSNQASAFRPPPPAFIPQRTSPLPPRSSTASPISSVRSSSTLSWHKTSPSPVVTSVSPSNGHGDTAETGGSVSAPPHNQRLSAQFMTGAGTVLDPAVIVEEAESYASTESGTNTPERHGGNQ